MKNNKKGFTLIELIIVTVILGILAAVAVPRYMGTVNRSEASAEDAVLTALLANAEAYAMETFIDTGRKSYPFNPFSGGSVDGYNSESDEASVAGEWAWNETVGLITHMRNDDSIWEWSYSISDSSDAQGDDRGGFGNRHLDERGGDDTESGTGDDL